MVTGLWNTHDPNFGSLSWFWMCKEHSCPLSPHLGIERMLEVPDWGLASWSWFGYGHWSLIKPWSKFWFSILILKVQRTSISFKSWSVALKNAEVSWHWFDIVILIWIWSAGFDTSRFQVLAIYLDSFKVRKTLVSLKSWFWFFEDFGGSWFGFSILTMIWKGWETLHGSFLEFSFHSN